MGKSAGKGGRKRKKKKKKREEDKKTEGERSDSLDVIVRRNVRCFVGETDFSSSLRRQG